MSLLEIVRDFLGNRIQVIDIGKLDYYDVNIGTDMAVALTEPTGGIDVQNDLIPFPENIDEADEGMKVYGMELRYNIDETIANPTETTTVQPLGTLSFLEMHIGYFEFDEIAVTEDFSTDLLEELEERLATLRIGTRTQIKSHWDGINDISGQTLEDIQLTDAIVFPNGFDFPLNPSAKFIWYKNTSYEIMSLQSYEDLLTLRIWYKVIKRPKNIFTKILSLFRQNISS